MAVTTGHPPVDKEQFQILGDGLNQHKKRKVKEALFIKEQQPSLNEQGHYQTSIQICIRVNSNSDDGCRMTTEISVNKKT